MSKFYKEREQFDIIEMIFNQIILKKFAKEYHDLVKYDRSRKNCLIFNSSDLMCDIFQYLTYGDHFDGDLFSCSLVSSHWLYHVWNINSVYFVNLTDLFWITFPYQTHDENNILRIWQRLVNARSIYFINALIQIDYSQQVIDKISMLEKITTMDVTLIEESILILKVFIQHCRKRIKKSKIRIVSKQENQLSPLNLTNVEYVSISDLYCYRNWSNKCRQLVLKLRNMSQQWLEFVIQNCDCSNVDTLDLCLARDNDIEIDEMLLKQFVSKLVALRRLILLFHHHFDHSELLLWKLLIPTIEKQNGTVEMVLDDNYPLRKDESILLHDRIDKQHLRIDTLNKIRRKGSLTGKTVGNWIIGEMIGQRQFSNVYRATHVTNGTKAAAKCRSRTPTQRIMSSNEIGALSKTNHRNIIKLVSNIRNTGLNPAILVFEYMKNGDLYNYLKYTGRFELPICKRFFDQIVDALDYLHNTLNITHSYLNPKSILLDDNFNIKIANFGFCKMINAQNMDVQSKSKGLLSTRLGTPGYIAPEIFFQGKSGTHTNAINASCDVFSLGIILWQMLMGINSQPFENFTQLNPVFSDANYPTYKLIEQKKYDLWWKKSVNDNPYYYDNDLKHLFTRLFDQSPKTRITVSEIQKHEWYTKNHAKYQDDRFVTEMKKLVIQKDILMLCSSRNEKILHDCEITEPLGQGKFGSVLLGKHTKTNQKIAVKHIILKDQLSLEFIRTEFTSLKKLSTHLNIVNLLHFQIFSKKVSLCFEYCQYGDLYGLLNQCGHLSMIISFKYFLQLLAAISKCHNMNIVHKNLSLQNILVSDTFQLKIADFGLESIIDRHKPKYDQLYFVGMSVYKSPELIQTDTMYDISNIMVLKACDIFSLSIIFWQMMNGIKNLPFQCYKNNGINYGNYGLIKSKQFEKFWNVHRQCNFVSENRIDLSLLCNLFERMFEYNPFERITINAILSHEYIQSKDNDPDPSFDIDDSQLEAFVREKYIKQTGLMESILNTQKHDKHMMNTGVNQNHT